MKPVDMIVKHDPANGSWGDCTRACVASIFELPAEEVPHFAQYGEEEPVDGVLPWITRLRQWLTPRGFGMIFVEVQSKEQHWSGEAMAFHHMRAGKTRRGTFHDTVYFGDILAHDPQHEDRAGLLEDEYPICYTIFVKL